MSCLFMLSGCSLATLPVKATSKVVDWSTTSQDEADRNRGREMRKRDKAYERCARRPSKLLKIVSFRKFCEREGRGRSRDAKTAE
ncbi:MAG: hypothetical protein QM605_13145 [Sphingobium sp.]